MMNSEYYLTGEKVIESASLVEVAIVSEKNGIRRIRCGKEWNYIDEKGNLLSPDNFKDAHDFCEGYGRVKNEVGEYNYIDQYGNLLSDTWFAIANDFSEGYGTVKNKAGEWNYINKEGKMLFKDGFEYANSFINGYSVVRNENKFNYATKDGKLLSDIWFTRIHRFDNGQAKVINEKMEHNYIGEDGKLLNEAWLMDVNIVYTRICGLNKPPHKSEMLGCFFWGTNLARDFDMGFVVGYTKEEAEAKCREIRNRLSNAGIIDGQEVVLILGEEQTAVRAIGVIGEDYWLDVRYDFTSKSFNDFNFNISSLKVGKKN